MLDRADLVRERSSHLHCRFCTCCEETNEKLESFAGRRRLNVKAEHSLLLNAQCQGGSFSINWEHGAVRGSHAMIWREPEKPFRGRCSQNPGAFKLPCSSDAISQNLTRKPVRLVQG